MIQIEQYINNKDVFFVGGGEFLSNSENTVLIIGYSAEVDNPFFAFAIDLKSGASDGAYSLVDNDPKDIEDLKYFFDLYIKSAITFVSKDTLNLMEV